MVFLNEWIGKAQIIVPDIDQCRDRSASEKAVTKGRGGGKMLSQKGGGCPESKFIGGTVVNSFRFDSNIPAARDSQR